MKLLEYLDESGDGPFSDWLDDLDPQAAAKVDIALTRMEGGNLSNVKNVGEGVLEYRLNFGPGYRIYFGRQGNDLIILLAGGSKRRQQEDIASPSRDGETTRSAEASAHGTNP